MRTRVRPTVPEGDMEFRTSVANALREAADPVRAPQQQAYMKSEMPCLGVTVPECRREALKHLERGKR